MEHHVGVKNGNQRVEVAVARRGEDASTSSRCRERSGSTAGAPRTRRRARLAIWRAASGVLPRITAISPNGTANMSCRMTRLVIHRTDHSHADASLYPPVMGTAQRVRSYDGTELAVLVAGDGPSLVFAYGSLVSSVSWALMWRPLLDAGYRLIAYDLRGHGLSTLGADGFGAAPYGRDLAAVLDNAKGRQRGTGRGDLARQVAEPGRRGFEAHRSLVCNHLRRVSVRLCELTVLAPAVDATATTWSRRFLFASRLMTCASLTFNSRDVPGAMV
jgi:hypothetical protein